MNNINNNDEERYKLAVSKIEDFSYPMRTGYATTVEICKRINKLLYSTFCDFAGSQITPINGNAYLYLHFREPGMENEKGLERAFEPVQLEHTNNIAFMAMNLSNIAYKKRRYKITKAGSDVLSQFLHTNPKNPYEFNAEKLTTEETVTTYIAGTPVDRVQVKAFGFDINKILRKVYPDIKDNELIMLSLATVVNDVNNSNGRFNNGVYRIDVIDLRQYQKLGEKYGLGGVNIPGGDNPDIIRGI